jgi:hypothetical protein
MTAAMAAALISAVAAGGAAAKQDSPPGRSDTVVYDTFDGGSAGYAAKWGNPFGPGEGTKSFNNNAFNISATPYTTGADYSVFDHLKYIGISNATFPAPKDGSVTFASDISAATPGTVNNLTQHGVYGPSGTWTNPSLQPPGFPPYTAKVLQGQQAGAVMNMFDPCTGQLFDWFVAGDTAFALIERLPTNVTTCPGQGNVGKDKMYTQIIREVPAKPGVAHHVSITYSQSKKNNSVEYHLDGKKIATVDSVGIPLDKQGENYTGTYPSLGPGENLNGKIDSFVIGHGLFSLIDAFPFQHPDRPDLDVSIPVGSGNPADAGRARLFGQGTRASFDNFTVSTVDKDK